MIDQNTFKKLSVFVVLGILGILSLFIIWPIVGSIAAGLLLAFAFFPIYKKVFSVIKEKNISAIIIIILALLVIIVPLWFLLPIIAKQIFDVYLYVQKINLFEFIKDIFPSFARIESSSEFVNSINSFLTNVISKVLLSATSVFLDLPALVLRLVIVFFVFFFGMRDAEALQDYVSSLSPFSQETEKELKKKFKDITSSVIYGLVLIGILQGVLTGIGLFVFKVPQALALTIIAIIAAIIPVLGAWVVWFPSGIYLLVSGRIFPGIILLIYGAGFVGWIDNIIRPYIVARKTNLSSGIIVIGMLGGLLVFGILGLIMGPLIIAYLLLFLDAYRKNKFPSLFSA